MNECYNAFKQYVFLFHRFFFYKIFKHFYKNHNNSELTTKKKKLDLKMSLCIILIKIWIIFI